MEMREMTFMRIMTRAGRVERPAQTMVPRTMGGSGR